MSKIIFSNNDLFVIGEEELKKISVGDTVRVYLKNNYDYSGIISEISDSKIMLEDLNCSSCNSIKNDYISNIKNIG
ncbi:hypothetical protein [Clostridium thermobutyricum]|uniref:hypothetical protein n=1 Tax=Clostridium thermobutyricum TaxID=29372 RepID=UPI0018AA43FB|nr:hypothetical protein [Clostridium thermobutyricum]